MQFLRFEHGPSGAIVQVSRFSTEGGADEFHLCATPGDAGSFDGQLSQLEQAYRYALRRLELSEDSAVFRRLFVSDIANQADRLDQSWLVKPSGSPVAVSIVQQPPLPERKVVMRSYHLRDVAGLDKRADRSGVIVSRAALSHVWTAGLTACADGGEQPPLSYDQSQRIFGDYLEVLGEHGATLAEHVIRTWLFVHNVDLNYQGLVRGRRELFAQHGLTPETHFISSTGIEGRSRHPQDVVLMDAYAIAGIAPEQIRYLTAPEHLCPTSRYGVTFERGTRVDYGDRRHVLISGTASIDVRGEIVHPGDVVRQLGRTLDNIGALLADAETTFGDATHLIVYLRDAADRPVVEHDLARRLPDIPRLFVRAPVCRPGWLIEIECMAIAAQRDSRWQPL